MTNLATISKTSHLMMVNSK